MRGAGRRNATTSPARSQAQALRQEPGYAVVPLSSPVNATLVTALKAFQGQLHCWSQDPPLGDYRGFQSFPRKHRLEFCPGHAGLENLGVLQQMAIEVVQTYNVFAQAILDELATALSLPATHFRSALDVTQLDMESAAASSLEAIQYPALDVTARLAVQHASCEAHVDRGLLTCIFADTPQGLQVQQASGDWEDVTVPAGHVLVLPGYTLERATCGLVKATIHRVVMPLHGASCARNALVYKLRSPDSAVLSSYTHLKLQHADNIPVRYRGPIAVGELMHFFDATHESINDPARVSRLESASLSRPTKRIKTDAATLPVSPATLAETQHQNAQQHQAQIRLTLMSLTGAQDHFYLLPATLLLRVFVAYACKTSKPLDTLRFIWKGKAIDGRSTVQHYKIEDQDVIHVITHLSGD